MARGTYILTDATGGNPAVVLRPTTVASNTTRPNGGPVDTSVTGWIEKQANKVLQDGLQDMQRIPFEQALHASTTHWHDFLNAFVNDLGNVVDPDAIRDARIRVGVDPHGGAGVHYWSVIVARYKLDLTVVNWAVDATFRFITVDWDGQIRMDPSSPYAMQSMIGLMDHNPKTASTSPLRAMPITPGMAL